MFSVHFPKENVQQNKMLQMHFCNAKRTFYGAEHLTLENVMLNILQSQM